MWLICEESSWRQSTGSKIFPGTWHFFAAGVLQFYLSISLPACQTSQASPGVQLSYLSCLPVPGSCLIGAHFPYSGREIVDVSPAPLILLVDVSGRAASLRTLGLAWELGCGHETFLILTLPPTNLLMVWDLGMRDGSEILRHRTSHRHLK